ncbi:MAG: glycosyltransferase family 39 protein, partial [Anaerolineae bacterium]|nr:glycosyltransferase family 39 protein [Anaerolineae bacterium]
MPITIQPHRKLIQRRSLLALLAVILLSIPVKLIAARLLVWDLDFVPVISRGRDFLHNGTFPAYGTLSSVAAYNMPLLVWLQIPLLTITKHVPTVLIGTQLIFNLLATIFLYRIGSRFFNGRIGLAAAALFTFSEIGISSAYTAWAQMLLPGFFIFTLYNLMQWAYSGRGWFLGGAIFLATAATMTHFSAILLYPVILVFGVITHARWSKRGLTAGIIGSLIL